MRVEDMIPEHAPALLALARRLLSHEQRAEDAVQEVWLRAYLALERGEEVRDVQAWLFVILDNYAKDLWRRERRRATWDGLELEPAAPEPEESLRPWEVRTILDRIFAELPVEQREILEARCSGKDFNQIAGQLGCTPDAARARAQTARIAAFRVAKRLGIELPTVAVVLASVTAGRAAAVSGDRLAPEISFARIEDAVQTLLDGSLFNAGGFCLTMKWSRFQIGGEVVRCWNAWEDQTLGVVGGDTFEEMLVALVHHFHSDECAISPVLGPALCALYVRPTPAYQAAWLKHFESPLVGGGSLYARTQFLRVWEDFLGPADDMRDDVVSYDGRYVVTRDRAGRVIIQSSGTPEDYEWRRRKVHATNLLARCEVRDRLSPDHLLREMYRYLPRVRRVVDAARRKAIREAGRE